jgi:3D (Asp-Asp-Asp) domain-containing protein
MQTPGRNGGRSAFSLALLLAVAVFGTACSHLSYRLPSTVSEGRAAARAPAPDEPLLAPEDAAEGERSLVVTATAYNAVRSQTGRVPDVGAWGDRLKPGMKVIAVTPDLLELGLKRGDVVKIEGIEGEWTVMDKVPKRWKRRIDLFMGKDVRAARNWGKREVRITW